MNEQLAISRMMHLFVFTWGLIAISILVTIVLDRFAINQIYDHSVRLEMLMNFKQDKPSKAEVSALAWKAGPISGCATDEMPVLLGVGESDPRSMQWLCAKSNAIRPQ